MAFQNDPKYIKFLKLYRKSQENLELGNPGKFFDLYYEALKLQVEAQRKKKLPEMTNLSKKTFPEEIWLHVLAYLATWELVALLPVSKDFYDLAIDGQIWEPIYRERWPKDSAENKEWILHPYLEDWYGKFWCRHLLQTSPNVIDIGTCDLKFLSGRKNRSFSTLPARYKVVDLTPAGSGHYRSGLIINVTLGTGTRILNKKSNDPSGTLWFAPIGKVWDEMVEYFTFSNHPNIFLNSPYPRIVFPNTGIPPVTCETSVCTIRSYKLRSGVVVSFGHSGAWLQVVRDGEIEHTEIFAKPPEHSEEYSEHLVSGFASWVAENDRNSGVWNFCFIGGGAVDENVATFLSFLDSIVPPVEYKVVSSEKDRFYAPLLGALKIIPEAGN
jgi:hypothetical protein